MSHITHYRFSVTLPKGWEENPEEAVEIFTDELSKKSDFIERVNASDMIKLQELTISFDVSVVMKEEVTSDESLDTNFWLKVAAGATNF